MVLADKQAGLSMESNGRARVKEMHITLIKELFPFDFLILPVPLGVVL